MKHSHVLITGAAGFTGSWLASSLAASGAKVTALITAVAPDSIFNRQLAGKIGVVYGSVLDYDVLVRVIAQRSIDTVFHLAAISLQPLAQQHPREAFEVNVRGTYTLLEACRVNRDRVRRIVVASSDKVYGESDSLPYREDHPLLGVNPYEASKCCADVIARSYCHSYGLPVVVGRFGNVYGGGDLNWSRLIPGTIHRLLQGKPPIIRNPAGGEFRRDFIYVRDIVKAYRAMHERLHEPGVGGSAFNFGTGQSFGIAEVVGKIQHLMGREDLTPIVVSGAPGEITSQVLSSDRARSVLDWSPSTPLDEGLAATVAWYQRYLTGGS